MRRLSRLDRSIDRLRSRSTSTSSSFLCSACLRRAPFSTLNRCLAAPGKIPRTERLRRRIWGTDEPPGLEDPYGGPSIVEERQAARQIERSIQEPARQSQSKTPTPVLDVSYEPAKTWDGLEEVGELPAPEFYFEGFMPAEKVTDPYEATVALHRAAVEVLTLKQAGRPLSELSNATVEVDRTNDIHILVSRTNPSAPLLRFPESSSEQALLEALSQRETVLEEEEGIKAVDTAESIGDVYGLESTDTSVMRASPTKDGTAENALAKEVEAYQPINYEQKVASWKSSWLQTSLDDAEIKFAIVKRVMQLTGIRIPDSAINSAHTLRLLLTHVTRKPKPAKLFDALAEKEDLVTLPNVKIFNRRITPIDKEKMVGRWKIIERELERRGLPVTGRSL